MNLLSQTEKLCRLYDIKPARSRGQNFLINEKIYDDIVKTAELKPDDIVLEIGPGLGFLTIKLAKKVKRVIAVELDDKLAEVLRTGLIAQNINNAEVINKDIMKCSLKDLGLADRGFKIVANLPYNITSLFLREFLSSQIKPSMVVLMLQKEVARRIVTCPPQMSLLTVAVQFYTDPEIIKVISADNFWPQPKVDSAIIKLAIKKEKIAVDEKYFFRLVKIGFSAKRKMLKNNLAAGFHIKQEEAAAKITAAGFSPKIRPQELGLKDWVRLLGSW